MGIKSGRGIIAEGLTVFAQKRIRVIADAVTGLRGYGIYQERKKRLRIFLWLVVKKIGGFGRR